MIIKIIYILIILLATGTLDARLMWPIDRPKRITGSFAEYRGINFHHGIDVSTGGKKGFKVFAANTGYVSSIMYQKWGIGYAVFVKHRDGSVTFYGHLDRFARRILRNRKVKKKMKLIRNRRDFRIDFSKPEIYVKRGSILGYSGDSGRGLEHFHFEIRDKNNNPLNPLKNGIKVSDYSSPKIIQLHLVPIGPRSHINGLCEETIFESIMINKKRKKYTIKSDIIPTVGGKIGIKLRVYDKAGYKNRVGIFGYKSYLNGKAVYENYFSKLDMKISHRLGLYLDYDYSNLRDYTYFIYSRLDKRGSIDTNGKDKIIKVKIFCYDANNNRSYIEFKLKTAVVLTKPAFEYKTNLYPGKKLKIYSIDNKFKLLFNENSGLYKEMVQLKIEKNYEIDVNLLTKKSQAYSVKPTNLCLDSPARIEIKYSGSDRSKVGIYKKSKRYFYFISNSFNNKTKSYSAKVRKMGTFFLVKDDYPPVILFKNNIKRRRYRSIKIRIRDIGSGVDFSKVYLKVDGKDVIWDYEIDRRYIEILPHNRIWKKGKHIIKIGIIDRAGNSSDHMTYYYFI